MPKEAKDLNVAFLYDFYGQLLTEKQQEAIEMYYNEDLSLAEIASECNISRQGVRDSIKRGEMQLYDFENALGLAKKFTEIKNKLEEISNISFDLESNNISFYSTGDIMKRAKRISDLCKEIKDGI